MLTDKQDAFRRVSGLALIVTLLVVLSSCAIGAGATSSGSVNGGATATSGNISGPPANIPGRWYGTTSYSGNRNLPAKYDIWMDITQPTGSTAVSGRFEICWEDTSGEPVMRAWPMSGTVTSTSVTFDLEQGVDISRAAGQVKPNEMDLTLTDTQANVVGITTMAPGIAPPGFGACG